MDNDNVVYFQLYSYRRETSVDMVVDRICGLRGLRKFLYVIITRQTCTFLVSILL